MNGADDGAQRTGWGLPRAGTTDAPGASWEGEGQQARPEPPARGRRGRAVLVVAAGVLLGGGALLLAQRGEDPVPGPEPEQVAQDAAEVEPGLCLGSLPSESSDPLDVLACDVQHLGEVVAVIELDDGAYPGDDEVLAAATQQCTAAFAEYGGTPVAASGLGLLPVVPRESDWRVDGDRTVVCIAEGPALVGSVRGAPPQ